VTAAPILVAVRHRTAYRYDRPVVLGPQTVRLRPAPHARPPVLSYALTVLPEPHTRHWHQDPQGNFLARVSFPEPTARFELTVELTADVAAANPFDFVLEPEAAAWPFRYPALLAQELLPYRATEPVRPWLAGLLADLPLVEQPSLDLLVALNQLVRRRVAYVARAEPGVRSPGETLARGSGSCRDVAWLLVRAARGLGYAARFASGYLIQLADAAAAAAGAGRTAPTCTRGRRCTFPVPAGSGSTRPRG
jgi:transglutaminase-like putative cysteine protease